MVSILGPNSFWDGFVGSNKTITCCSREGKHILVQSGGQLDHNAQDTFGLHRSNMLITLLLKCKPAVLNGEVLNKQPRKMGLLLQIHLPYLPPRAL